LLLYAGTRPDTPISRALCLGPIRFVGKISYSLYLWHLPLLVLARIELDRDLRLTETWLLIALAAGIAALSWKFVETPFRRMPLGGRSRGRVIAAGVTGSFVFGAAGASRAPW
jgi:peptidoglycan/LPS O-acetylase OafA/YrhL